MDDLELWKEIASDPHANISELWETIRNIYPPEEAGRIWMAIHADTDTPET